MTTQRTPAQLYSLIFGAVLLLIGIVGFAVDSSFTHGSNPGGMDLILFKVNGWHNIVHIASGLLGLALWRGAASAKAYALGFGAVYGIVTVYGLIAGSNVLGIVAINDADNVLHLAISALGIVAGLASRSVPERRRTAAARTA